MLQNNQHYPKDPYSLGQNSKSFTPKINRLKIKVAHIFSAIQTSFDEYKKRNRSKMGNLRKITYY